jgi:hypothetical protein
VDDAQLIAPAVADVDDPGILVTGRLAHFGGQDLVDLGLGDDGRGRRVSRSDLGVGRQRNQNRRRNQNSQCNVFHGAPLTRLSQGVYRRFGRDARRNFKIVFWGGWRRRARLRQSPSDTDWPFAADFARAKSFHDVGTAGASVGTNPIHAPISCSARFLRREFFTFIPVGKIWIATNNQTKDSPAPTMVSGGFVMQGRTVLQHIVKGRLKFHPRADGEGYHFTADTRLDLSSPSLSRSTARGEGWSRLKPALHLL